MLVMLSTLDTELTRHPCNALHTRDIRIIEKHGFQGFCFRQFLMSNIVFTHIKFQPGTFKMITPIPDKNQDDKMSIFPNIFVIVSEYDSILNIQYSGFSKSTDALGVEYVESNPTEQGTWVLQWLVEFNIVCQVIWNP